MNAHPGSEQLINEVDSRLDQMASEERLIKKYPNRRLYDTATSAYNTLSDVKQLVVEKCLLRVIDAKTGDDLTRAILLQIITEEESNGSPIFSSQMLYQIIQFYGDAFQQMMSCYLEKNIETFVEIQNKLQKDDRKGDDEFIRMCLEEIEEIPLIENNYRNEREDYLLDGSDEEE